MAKQQQQTKTTKQACLNLANLIPCYNAFDVDSKKYYFDPLDEKGFCCLDFFPKFLRHAKGSLTGTPFYLEDWEKAILLNVFGWKNKETHFRRYREVFIYVPRKNGKTTFAAGIVLYVLFCDGELGAEIYSAAAEREQAALVFNQAKYMVGNCKNLSDASSIYTKSITLESTNSFYKAISSDASTKHGYNTHLAIIDELHAQPNRELVDVLATSTGARNQPLIIYITTSDFDRESICNEKLDYAKKVRDGIIKDDSFLPVIYEASRTDDWTSPEVWKEVNPNLGVSISYEYMANQCEKAKESTAYRNTFKRLHLNIKTETKMAWLNMEKWRECHGIIKPDELRGKECFGGLDLSNIQDLTAFVLAFPLPDDCYALLAWHWIPKEGAEERSRNHSIPYLAWHEQNLITLTEGQTIDYRFVRRDINDISRLYDIKDIAFDPYNSTQFCKELRDEDGFNLTEMRQGTYTMNEPSKTFEQLVIAGKLDHGNNDLLTWQASNVSIIQDHHNNIKPVKGKDFNKVDGIIASIMAVARAMFTTQTKSIYETRGIISL